MPLPFTPRHLTKIALTALSLGGFTANASAQALSDVQTPTEPLTLKSFGSFYVGGDTVTQTPEQLSGSFGDPAPSSGDIALNQMYVQFMVPQIGNGVPVVMVHGATLSGKTFETTPDGRMGWAEYFVRKGHPVYVPDQIGRARSGTDIAGYNDVRAGNRDPASLPNAFRISAQLGWNLFRFGPTLGQAYDDEQFPVDQAEAFGKQAVPDFWAALPDPNPNYSALADLAAEADGAVLMGHSQAGSYPVDAALVGGDDIRGLIMVEPGQCGSPDYTDAQIDRLTQMPILVVFGDHLDGDTGFDGFSWQSAYEGCEAFIGRINDAGGAAEMLHPADLGIHGNSHMIMQDRNNLQIADLILDWMDQNVVPSGSLQ